MQTYCEKTTVLEDGTLTIKGLPFRAGDKVEVTICSREHEKERQGCYLLRGKPIRYVDPFGSVAEGDWDALK